VLSQHLRRLPMLGLNRLSLHQRANSSLAYFSKVRGGFFDVALFGGSAVLGFEFGHLGS